MNKSIKIIDLFEKNKINKIPEKVLDTVLYPKEGREYSGIKVRDLDMDEFASYVKDFTDLDNGFNKNDILLSVMFPSGVFPELKGGSGYNKDEYFKKYGSLKSAMYDIWTEYQKSF